MSKKYELTPVFDGAKDLPVRKGWYLCVLKDGTYQDINPQKWPRRYWNGGHFSGPCHVDCDDTNERLAKRRRAFFDSHKLQWCGLTAPYRE